MLKILTALNHINTTNNVETMFHIKRCIVLKRGVFNKIPIKTILKIFAAKNIPKEYAIIFILFLKTIGIDKAKINNK